MVHLKTLEYTVTRPATVDSCAWFISTDEAGNNPVSDDVASIILADKGEKATITWKKQRVLKIISYKLKSVAATGESDPVHMAVRVEDFSGFCRCDFVGHRLSFNRIVLGFS